MAVILNFELLPGFLAGQGGFCDNVTINEIQPLFIR